MIKLKTNLIKFKLFDDEENISKEKFITKVVK